jgi:dihydrofolate reductase
MVITLLVGASANNAIGKNNQLLWHLPNDLKFFKNATWAMPVAMGRKTFESLGGKPLNGRLNIVITKQKDFISDGIIVVESIEDAISFAKKNDYKEIMIAGGGEIYKQAIPIATKVLITRVHTIIEGDTFFPVIDTNVFQLVKQKDYPADAKHQYAYTFETWERK